MSDFCYYATEVVMISLSPASSIPKADDKLRIIDLYPLINVYYIIHIDL